MDAAFLYAETPEMPMHVGSLAYFMLPDDDADDFYEAFKNVIVSRMASAPMLKWKLEPAQVAEPRATALGVLRIRRPAE